MVEKGRADTSQGQALYKANIEGGKRPADHPLNAKRRRVEGAEVTGQRLQGTVKSFAGESGTLSSPGLAQDVAFQKASLPAGTESVSVGQSVEFVLAVGENVSAESIALIH
ncbi:unnamed protein product [Effrenium voratum]|nr:unnamed protein product [Effrenium voratum]